MSILSIHIHNFLSHSNTIIQFYPGFNCIIGSTDAGKSSIIKAFLWLKDNYPLGDDFISHFCNKKKDTCFVSISTSEGHILTREKLPNDNIYRLDSLDLRGFNKGVPEEIKQVLNMSDINIQKQGKSYFLFDQTPPEIGRYLNKIVHIDLIDKSFTRAESEKREREKKKKKIEKDIENLENRLKQYQDLEEIEKDLIYLEDIDKYINELENKYNRLVKNEKELSMYNHEIEMLNKRLSVLNENELNNLISLNNEVNNMEDRSNKLTDLFNQLCDVEEEIYKYEKFLKIEIDLNNAIKINEEKIYLENRINKIESLYLQLKETNNKIKRKEIEITNLEQEFKSSFPNECPFDNICTIKRGA